MQKKTASPRWHSYLLLLITTVIWSASFIVVKPSFEVTTPFRYLLYRYVIAIVLTWPIVVYYWHKLKPSIAQIALIGVLELLGTTISLGAVYLGLQYTTTITANLLITPTPVLITLFSLILLKEREEQHEWLGLLICFLVTLFLAAYPLIFHDPSALAFSLVGNVLVLVHLVANSLYSPLAKKYYHHLPKLFVAAISFYVGALSFLFLSWWELEFSWTALWTVAQHDLLEPRVWWASGYMSVLGSIVALTAYIKGQDGIEASEASLFGYLSPLISLPLAMFFLGEVLNWKQASVLPLLVLGVIIAEKRFSRSRLRSGHHTTYRVALEPADLPSKKRHR